MSGCNPDFSEEQTIPAVIPYEGGTYNYHVNYVVTKWTVPVYYRNFRFMLTFDMSITDRYMT